MSARSPQTNSEPLYRVCNVHCLWYALVLLPVLERYVETTVLFSSNFLLGNLVHPLPTSYSTHQLQKLATAEDGLKQISLTLIFCRTSHHLALSKHKKVITICAPIWFTMAFPSQSNFIMRQQKPAVTQELFWPWLFRAPQRWAVCVTVGPLM